MAKSIAFVIDQHHVRTDGELVSLNDIYLLAGSPENQDPRQWSRLPQTIQLIEELAKKLHVGKSHMYKVSKARAVNRFNSVSHTWYTSPVTNTFVAGRGTPNLQGASAPSQALFYRLLFIYGGWCGALERVAGILVGRFSTPAFVRPHRCGKRFSGLLLSLQGACCHV